MIICDIKIDINMCEPHYFKLFFVNLLHSPGVSFFYIGHLFDNLTSFNIFIICIGSMGKGNDFASVCLFTGGVLSPAGGTYTGWGVPTLAREVPYLTGGTYLFRRVCCTYQMSKYVKLSKKISSCQKDVKCQKVKHLNYG